jgi:hypothetical protein
VYLIKKLSIFEKFSFIERKSIRAYFIGKWGAFHSTFSYVGESRIIIFPINYQLRNKGNVMKSVICLITCLSFLSLFVSCGSNSPNIPEGEGWARTYGGSNMEEACTVRQTGHGGFAFVAVTSSFGMGSSDIWLVKLTVDGDIAWEKTYGTNQTEYACSMDVTLDGGFIISAYDSYLGVDDRDFWRILLIKTDSDGVVEWQKAYEKSGVDITPHCDIRQISDGGFVLVGRTGYFTSYDGFLMKVSSAGVTEWIRLIDVDSGRDYATVVQETVDGGLIVAGCTDIWGQDANTVWIMKIANDGNTDWWKKFSTMNETSAMIGVRQTTDKGFVVAVPSSGNTQLLKLTENGVLVWQKCFGGGRGDIPMVVREKANNTILVFGETWSYGSGSSDIWVTNHGSDGSAIRQEAYGGYSTETCCDADLATNGDLIIAGTTVSFRNGTREIWVLNIPADDTLVGAPFVVGTPHTLQVSDIALTDISSGTSLSSVYESTVSLSTQISEANISVQYY